MLHEYLTYLITTLLLPHHHLTPTGKRYFAIARAGSDGHSFSFSKLKDSPQGNMKGPSLPLTVLCCVVLCRLVLCCVESSQFIRTTLMPVNIDSNILHFLFLFACASLHYFFSSSTGGGCERPCLDQETKVRRIQIATITDYNVACPTRMMLMLLLQQLHYFCL